MGRLLVLLILIAGLGYWAWASGDVELVDEIAIAEANAEADFESRMVAGANGVNLHVVFAGPEDGAPVILIHGFPEFWYSWRRQAAALGKAGYRVAVPDLRGYNRSDKPKGQDAYTIDAYAADIVALMDAEDWETAHIAGHDVGAFVAWRLVDGHPDRIDRAVVFNIPPPAALADAEMKGDESTSWYRTAFQVPFLPELALRAGGYRVLSRLLTKGAKAGAFSDQDMDIYRSAWARENAISTMLGFYRATDFSDLGDDGDGLTRPVFFVGAGKDAYVPAGGIEATTELLGAENIEVWPNASHWVLQEEPRLTVSAMIRHFGAAASTGE
ncbi:MAG: alpha/beta hydrolase [Pseudomonadota bacterium]